MAKKFRIGDRVDWGNDLSAQLTKELIEDLGLGPFVIHKTEMRKSEQFVVLKKKILGKYYILEDRERLFVLVKDLKNPVARIPANILKKV